MKTLHNVAPYGVKYRVWDTDYNEIVYETDDYDELCAVYYTCYTTRYYYEPHILKSEFNFRFRFLIKTEFGDDIPNEDLKRPRRGNYVYWWEKKEGKAPDIRYKKGNPDKIKRGYYNSQWYWETADYYEFPYITSGWFRRIQTMNEKRQNCWAVADYGITAVRGRRRGRNLHDSWDDPQCNAQDTFKSWKHHSKRRNQWRVKG